MSLKDIFSLGNKQKNEDLFNRISNSTNYQNQEAYDDLANYLNKTGEEGVFMDVEGTELSPRYNYSNLPLSPGGKAFSRQYK